MSVGPAKSPRVHLEMQRPFRLDSRDLCGLIALGLFCFFLKDLGCAYHMTRSYVSFASIRQRKDSTGDLTHNTYATPVGFEKSHVHFHESECIHHVPYAFLCELNRVI